MAASSAMLSPVVQTVVQMGFDASVVESLVQTKYLLTGQQYASVSDLVSDVLQAEQEDGGQRAPQSRGKRHLDCVSHSQIYFSPLVDEVRSPCIQNQKPKWKVPGELSSFVLTHHMTPEVTVEPSQAPRANLLL